MRYTRFFCLVQVPVYFAAFVVASVGASDSVVSVAFGNQAAQRFGFVVFVSTSCIAATCCGIFGAKMHNKFCLLVFALYMFSSFVLVAILEAMTATEMEPIYDVEFQKNCSYGDSSSTFLSQACKEYLQDDRRNKLREMWYDLFLRARDGQGGGEKWTRMLEEIQSLGRCCGFDPPYRCWFGENIKNSPKGNGSNPGICGEEPGWYPPSYDCDIEVIDIPGVV